MKKGLFTYIVFVCSALLLTGCIGKTLVDYSEEIPNEIWMDTDTLSTSFQIGDTSKEYHVELTMRFNTSYGYSNFYVLTIIEKPDGSREKKVQSFEVTDKAGKWLGSGFGDLHAYDFPIVPAYTTGTRGTYKVMVVQYMREEQLLGCKNRGLRIIKGRDKF